MIQGRRLSVPIPPATGDTLSIQKLKAAAKILADQPVTDAYPLYAIWGGRTYRFDGRGKDPIDLGPTPGL